jgi:membrane-associated phospholipid phosphatase
MNASRLILMGIGFLFAVPSLSQQTADQEPFVRHDSSTVAPITNDLALPEWHATISDAPSHWYSFGEQTLQIDRVRDIALLGSVTLALIAVDHETYSATRYAYEHSELVRRLSSFVVLVGDGKFQLALAGGFALYGVAGSDKRSLRTAGQIAESVIATGIVVQILKRVTGRESPAAASSSSGVWRFLPNLSRYNKNQPRYYSFPSGHMATTTAMLTVLNENYPEAKSWLRPASYGLIALLGAGLVAEKMHWYSDLPLAMGLGYSFGMIASHSEGIKVSASTERSSLEISLLPLIELESQGVSLAVSF